MLARRIAAATTAAVLAAPAAANAAPIIRHASEGPSATPLIVELALVAVLGFVALAAQPIGRLVRAAFARTRPQRRLPKAARAGGR